MKLSILVASRKNSKFLAKFLFSYFTYTENIADTEVLVMHSAQDTWNDELIEFFRGTVSFMPENLKLGRSGLHVYYNELLPFAKGEWVIYFCDDHCIVSRGWDQYLFDLINEYKLDSSKVYQIVPTWNNTGAMNQILSRGYIDAVGGNIGRYGNIDSYNNFVAAKLPQTRIVQAPKPIFHDFTHDPDIMTPKHNEVVGISPLLEKWDSPEVNQRIEEDAERLREAIKNGL